MFGSLSDMQPPVRPVLNDDNITSGNNRHIIVSPPNTWRSLRNLYGDCGQCIVLSCSHFLVITDCSVFLSLEIQLSKCVRIKLDKIIHGEKQLITLY